MKKLTSLAFATLLATTGTAAFAEQDIQKGNQVGPIAMTDAQMDNVAAGALLEVDVRNVANNNNVEVLKNFTVDVNAAVAAAVGLLGTAGAGAVAVQR